MPSSKTKPAASKSKPAATKGKIRLPDPKKGINWKSKLAQFRKVAAKKSGAKKPRRLLDDFTIVGPAVVPGLSEYQYHFDTSGFPDPATSIEWSIVDSDNATIDGATDESSVNVIFANNVDSVVLWLTFTVDDETYDYSLTISLVQVDIGDTTFYNNGTVSSDYLTPSAYFTANPPGSVIPKWITAGPPLDWDGPIGSNWQGFTYNGTTGSVEPALLVDSNSYNDDLNAFDVFTEVTLTAPDDNPWALDSIEIGYIQLLSIDGDYDASAQYGTDDLNRYYTLPGETALDWLQNPDGPVYPDAWPWYGGAMDIGDSDDGTVTTWNDPSLWNNGDSPKLKFPLHYQYLFDPTIETGNVQYDFTIMIAVRTTDSARGADQLYFMEASAGWELLFSWPITDNVSLVSLPSGWSMPSGPTEVYVNLVPGAINVNNDIPDTGEPYPYAFMQWIRE